MNLPGRDIEEEDEDHEARHALSTLFEAEEIKMKEDLLSRVAGELERKQSIFSRISDIINGGDSETPNKENTLKTFIDRLKGDKQEEEFLTNETPSNRRQRISEGKIDKTLRSKILINFS